MIVAIFGIVQLITFAGESFLCFAHTPLLHAGSHMWSSMQEGRMCKFEMI